MLKPNLRSSLVALALASAVTPSQAATITADVVALDQVQVYNRFGAFNPVGMMYALRRDVVVESPGDANHGKTLDQVGALSGYQCKVRLRDGKRPRPLVLRGNVGDTLRVKFTNLLCGSLSPVTHEEELEGGGGTATVNDRPKTGIATFSVMGLTLANGGTNTKTAGIVGIAQGASHTYNFGLEREGTHLIFDNGIPAGGEADGGGIDLGLIGAVNIEPAGSTWYRSQVTSSELAWATNPDGTLNYGATYPLGHPRAGDPILNILRGTEIIHSDLNAVITGFSEPDDGVEATSEGPFREFTVVFHDEMKAVQAFEVLDGESFHGVRDGFGVNYGAQSMGAALVSTREHIGPGANCAECAYEEMYLSSWALGDPALLAAYPDDPSNVHHSYLGDRVKFRNLHAGPKETHVFHLHAHQWLAQEGGANSTYLDSQSIGPRQGFTYEITYGGSGNRNGTVGDSIFHCHLYPHFAQGMWELWRVHDVYEDGTRFLPDGELGQGTDPMSGATAGGTPIPAVIPMPGQAVPPKPTYPLAVANPDPNNDGIWDVNPGYPFFVAGKAGHRAPQAPMDLVTDGGVPRHILTGGTRVTPATAASGEISVGQAVSLGDFSMRLDSVNMQILPADGTPLEKAAMAFHAAATGHPTTTPEGQPAVFKVNGKAPQPGAPFADPCPANANYRDYHVSAVQLSLVVNKAGWHDPQARINVLTADVAAYEGQKRTAEPFYFRAHSGDCIRYHHQNRLPIVLAKDDFQVESPTDVIGQHIHLVKFDVTSSDGSANGWNYEDATFSKEALQERIDAVNAPGGSVSDPYATGQQLAATATWQTTMQRWYADPLLNGPANDPGSKDRTLRTVFTHDHLSASSIQHHGFYSGLLIEPAGSQWLTQQGQPLTTGGGPEAIIECQAGCDSAAHPTHREFMMAIADFAILYDGKPGGSIVGGQAVGNAINKPPVVEAISAAHHHPFLVNYKHEPMELRITADGNGDGIGDGQLPLAAGAKRDMANIFRSAVHGDPFTPIFKAFEGDRVSIRLLQGAQEEQHVFNMHGVRWKREVSNPDSPYVGAQEVGISEHFEFNIDRLPAVAGRNNTADYLYHFGGIDSMWNGAWGFMRSFANPQTVDPQTQSPVDIVTLSTNPNGRDGALPGNIQTNSCPANAPLKTFAVQAWALRDLVPSQKLVYNATYGLYDDGGLILIRSADEAKYRNGSKQPEPLVIRANAGDCIVLSLTNKFPVAVPDPLDDAVLPPLSGLRVDDFRPSNRVGIHAQMLSYDVRINDGASVGYNNVQTATPNSTIVYTWYAGKLELDGNNTLVGVPVEFGPINLQPVGDVIKHGAQGLIGALIIEPAGATYQNLAGTANLASGTEAKITYLDNGVPKSFKEYVLLYQDGLNLYQNGTPVPDSRVSDANVEAEEVGQAAINYRTEPFWARLTHRFGTSIGPDGDYNDIVFPATFMLGAVETPVFKANAGDAVRFRVLLPTGRTRQRSFSVFGHDYYDLGMPNFGSAGASLLAPGKAITAELIGGAKPGTWLYRDGPAHLFAHGAWGRFEVAP